MKTHINICIFFIALLLFITPVSAQQISAEKDNIMITSQKDASCGPFSCAFDFEIKNIKALDKDFIVSTIFDNEYATNIQVYAYITEEYNTDVWVSNTTCVNNTDVVNNTIYEVCEDNGYFKTQQNTRETQQNINDLIIETKKVKFTKLIKKYSIENFKVVFDVEPNTAGKYDIKIESDGFELILDPWWNNTWSKKKQIDITVDSNKTDYQLKLIVPYDSDMNSTYQDLRFVDSTELISLPYWIETSNTTQATAWIKSNVSNTTALYMYYGNSDATSQSDGQATWIIFDDFEDDSFNSSKWISHTANSGTINEVGGTLIMYGATTNDHASIASLLQQDLRNKTIISDFTYTQVGAGARITWVGGMTNDINYGTVGTTMTSIQNPDIYAHYVDNVYETQSTGFSDGLHTGQWNYFNGGRIVANLTGVTTYNIDNTHASGNPAILIANLSAGTRHGSNLTLEYIAIGTTSLIEPTYSFGAEETIISFSGLSQSFNINSSTYDSLNLTFNVTSADLNTSLTKVYYAVNTTYNPDSYWSYINGTADKCLTCFTSDITNIINDQYYTTLCSSYYTPATYNFIQEYMVSAPYQIEEIIKTNSVKIKFQNITTEPNILYTLNAYVDNKTTTDKDLEIWVCNETYDFGDYKTDENCYAISSLNIDTPYTYVCANNSYNWIVSFSSDNLGYLNGVKITSTVYVIFSTEISISAKAWELRYITNNSNSYSTSTNNGGSWSNQIGTIAAHIHQRTSGIIGTSDQFLWYVYAENNDGTSANSSIQYDNITTVSYQPTQPILLTPFYLDVWSGINNITWTESNSPQGDNFTYNLYLHNVDGSYNQTISTGIDKDLTYYEWSTYSTIENGIYRINMTVIDNNSLSTSYIHLRTFTINNTYPISVCINVYDEITGTKLYIDSEGYKIRLVNSTTTTEYSKYISYKGESGGLSNPTYACDKSKTTYTSDDSGAYIECYISLSSKNETIYYQWTSAYNTPSLQVYNFQTSGWEQKAVGSSQESLFEIDNTNGQYTENDLSYIRFYFANGATTNFYYAFNFDNFNDNITIEHASEIVDIGVSDVLGDYAEHNYITNQVSNYSQDAYIIKLDDSITSCFTSISMLGVPISDTRFDFTRDGNIVTQHISDDSGNVGPRLDPTYLYTVVITNSEYGIRSFSLIPTTACTPLSYSVEININYSSVMKDLYYSIIPYHFLWENNNPNYAISVVASNNDLQSFGASISYLNGTIINTTVENASSGGGTIYISSDIGNYNGTLYLNLSFEKSGFDTYTVSKSVVLMYFEQLNDTLTGVLRRIRDGTTGIDLSGTEVSIIFIVFGFIIAIITSEFGLMSTILLIIYAAIGVYLEIISMAVFIILSILAYILSHNGET